MRRNRTSPFVKKCRLVAALGRRYHFFSPGRERIFRKEALLLQRRRDLVQRSLGLVFIYGMHEIVEVVEFIILVFFTLSSKNFHRSDLETMCAFYLYLDRRLE